MDSMAPGGKRTSPPSKNNKNKKIKKKKKFSIARFFGRLFLFLFTLGVIGLLTVAIFCNIFMTYVNTTLIPSLGEITLEEMTLSLASTIYYEDANGQQQILRTLHNSESNRELIEFDDLPKCLVDAIVAIEDHRFWEHKGVDWYGTARATLKSATGQDTQGGSTITQQLVRNITGEKEVTVKRKLREIFRSLEFDAKNSKEDILTLYLNKVYFGHGFSGIQTAAKGYFGKDVGELDLAESACIVGITNYPSLYDPLWKKEFKQSDGSVKTPRDFNKKRQETVLDEMLKYGMISEAECVAAKQEKLLFVDTPEYAALHGLDIDSDGDSGDNAVDTSSVYSWFEDQVISDAIGLIAEARHVTREYASDMLYSGGYHIYTTLDMDIQRIVDSVYQDRGNFNYPSAKGTPLDSAITVIDYYSGDVVAMAGGVGVKEQNRILNLATSPRQPGSSIKPMSIYGPALEYDVVSPVTVLDDYPIQVNDSGTGGYPKNSPAKYRGPVTIQTGVQYSINTIAVRTLQKLGVSRSFDFMEQNLGMDLDLRDLDSSPLALGGLTIGVTTEQVAAAYGAFANQGIFTPPHTISRIESNDHSEVLIDTGGQSRQAMKETTSYLMTKMLSTAVASGTGTEAQISGMHVAGKTGTTTNSCDRYFAGFTPYYSAAVWVGYAAASEKINASGNPAARIWQKVMSQIHAGLPDKSFPEKPSGITTASVCGSCGQSPSALCGDVVSGEVQTSAMPSGTCDCHTEVRVCTIPESGDVFLAGEFCPEENVSSRIMLKGREFLKLPDGGIVMSEDAANHLTYFNAEPCPVHDESFVEPDLPGEGEGDGEGDGNGEGDNNGEGGHTAIPRPGEAGWPTEPFNPSTTTTTNPTNPSHTTTPSEPSKPSTTTSPTTQPTTPAAPSVPDEPHNEPVEPDEPVLPPEPVLP